MFSVIIIVYNIQEYITQAIDSVLQQTYPAFEIIIVDDGSSDSTFEIATKALEGVKNSKVIRQENKGPGGARNRGIVAATGDYIVFLDGDDWLMESALDIFKLQLDSVPDAIFSNRTLFYEKDKSFKSDLVFTKSTQGKVAVGRELMRRIAITAKVFRREFLTLNKILFPEKMAWEDYPFSYSVLAKAKTINVITDVTYVYRKRLGSNASLTQENRLSEFFLQSRFRQIDMSREIFNNSLLPTIFKNFDFEKLEFDFYLMLDIKHLAKEANSDTLSHAMKRFKNFIQDNQEIIFKSVSLEVQKIYTAILDEDLGTTIALIRELNGKR